jgi:hypothetical protein
MIVRQEIRSILFRIACALTMLSGFSANACADITTGLVGWWKMDEGSGTVSTADSSGYGYTGTLVNSPTWVAGKKGNALSFNGSGQGINISDIPGIQYPTISAWIKTTVGSGHVINRDYANSGSHRLWQYRLGGGIEVIFFKDDVTPNNATSATNVADGNWHLTTVTWDGTTIRAYVDGVADGTPKSFSGTLNSAANGISIGLHSWMTGGTDFVGVMDDVRIYSRALSASDVAELYNDGGGSAVRTKAIIRNGMIRNAQF